MRALGGRGFRYRVETSTNLRDWTTWKTLTHTNRAMPLSHGQQDASSMRFYRSVQEEPFDEFDQQVHAILNHWEAPGAIITIVKDGQILLLRGYGTTKVPSRGEAPAVLPNTLTTVASVTKPFNAVALLMLVEDGLITWDDPVKKHIPEFQFVDANRTENTTLRDLITHRAGLPNFLGDPWSMTYTMEALLAPLSNATPQTGFRERHAYSQVGIAVLGEVVRRVTQSTWPEFVQVRILDPLKMENSYPDTKTFLAAFPQPDVVPHLMGRAVRSGASITDGPWQGVGPVYTPAGGLVTTGEDMAKYRTFLLAGGIVNGHQLLDSKAITAMYSPQVAEQSQWGPITNPFSDRAYCLGWVAHEYEQRRVLEHGGSNLGSSVVALMPEEGIGVFVSSGANYSLDSDRMVSALKFSAFDLALGLQGQDWIKVFSP